PRPSSAHPSAKIPELSSPIHSPPFIKNNSHSLFRYSRRVFSRTHMTIACVFLASHMPIRIRAHVFHPLLIFVLILFCASHRSLVLSSSLIDAISRVRSHVRASSCIVTFTRSHVSTFARHRERTFTRPPRHTSTRRLTYRPARAIRARAR